MKTKKQKTKTHQRTNQLLAELRIALPMLRDRPDEALLEFCRIPASTLLADAEDQSVPCYVMDLHYFTLAKRSARVRASGMNPDGSPAGSLIEDSTTPPLESILIRRCAGDTYHSV
jgi:hypothetical protein